MIEQQRKAKQEEKNETKEKKENQKKTEKYNMGKCVQRERPTKKKVERILKQNNCIDKTGFETLTHTHIHKCPA